MSKDREIEVIARGAALRDGSVLLCRNVKRGYAYLPGGHVEFEESAATALAREFKEETGLDVHVGRCLLVTEGAFTQNGKPRHEINVVFHVEHLNTTFHEEVSDQWPKVPSLEPRISFDWVELAAVIDHDVRPDSIKAWLAAGAPAPTAGVEWVSLIRPRAR